MAGAPEEEASAAVVAAPAAVAGPNHTLYLRGLDEKMRPERLRLLLYTSFSRFGNILDIVCLKRNSLRGQAWIVFKDPAQATLAKSKMDGLTMFGEKVSIEFALAKSDIVARMDGTFVPRPKRKPAAQGAAAPPKSKRAKTEEDAPGAAAEAEADAEAPARTVVDDSNPPHNTLLAQGLPKDCTKTALELLFKQFKGFQAARLVPERQVAFIDFDDVPGATEAKAGVQGFALTADHNLQLTFAKQ